jgi:glycosyltransferase involved in cell wall biosynthesis
MILSKDLWTPGGLPGGVVSVVASLMRHSGTGVRYTHFRIGRRPGGWRNPTNWIFPLRDAYRLSNLVGQTSFDAVHLNPSLNTPSLLRDGLLMLALRVAHYRRSLVMFHGWENDVADRIRRSLLLRRLFLATFGTARRTLVLSRDFAETLVAIGYAAESVETISTLFDGEDMSSAPQSPQQDPNTLLYLSRFVPQKGAGMVVDAFGLLASKYPKLRLLMAGDGPLRSDLEKRVAAMGLSGRVEFLGYVRDSAKVEAFRRATIFVFPSTYPEGCPVVVLEAMGTGLPIVCSGAGGLGEVVVDGEHGIVTEPPTARSVADGVGRLLADPDRARAIGERNRRHAWETYEARPVARKFAALYARTFSGAD